MRVELTAYIRENSTRISFSDLRDGGPSNSAGPRTAGEAGSDVLMPKPARPAPPKATITPGRSPRPNGLTPLMSEEPPTPAPRRDARPLAQAGVGEASRPAPLDDVRAGPVLRRANASSSASDASIPSPMRSRSGSAS